MFICVIYIMNCDALKFYLQLLLMGANNVNWMTLYKKQPTNKVIKNEILVELDRKCQITYFAKNNQTNIYGV